MSTWNDDLLENAHNKMRDALDDLEDIMAWAEDEGYRAIQHKLEESWGSINSAMGAAAQYDDGTLERRE